MQRTKNFETILLFKTGNFSIFLDIFVIDVDAHRLSLMQCKRIEFKLETDEVALPDSKLLAGEGGTGEGISFRRARNGQWVFNQNDVFLQEFSVMRLCTYTYVYKNAIVGRRCLRFVLYTLVVV